MDASVTMPGNATTRPIGHGYARSWRQRSRIGRPWSTVVAAVWDSRCLSVAVPGRAVRAWSISVAVPGRYVRAWSISVAVPGFYIWAWSISVAVAGLDIRG